MAHNKVLVQCATCKRAYLKDTSYIDEWNGQCNRCYKASNKARDINSKFFRRKLR